MKSSLIKREMIETAITNRLTEFVQVGY